jgi:hypothetical protein
MGFSVTPKMHGMESHVVRQMRTTPGGIGMLMEYWIEQYHQIGFRFDQAYCRVGSLVGQEAIRSSAEKRGRNPRVQLNKMLLEKRFVGIQKKRSAAIKSHVFGTLFFLVASGTVVVCENNTRVLGRSGPEQGKH